MSILNITTAKRENAKILLFLAGQSGSGKTYSALKLAEGMVNGDTSKIALIDTENGRGRFYSDILSGPFTHADFPAPFSPARYAEAIKELESMKKFEVCIIDSITHEWEGTGGCEEIATGGNSKNPRWNIAKAEHKKMMNVLLNSSMHLIICARAREKVKIRNEGGRTIYEDIGLQPIVEKNFVFEMTASLMLYDQGKRRELIKVNDDLMPVLGRQSGYLGVDEGRALAEWVSGGDADPYARIKAQLRIAAEEGTEALKSAWSTLDVAAKQALKQLLDGTLKSSAEAADKQRAIEQQAPDESTLI